MPPEVTALLESEQEFIRESPGVSLVLLRQLVVFLVAVEELHEVFVRTISTENQKVDWSHSVVVYLIHQDFLFKAFIGPDLEKN